MVSLEELLKENRNEKCQEQRRILVLCRVPSMAGPRGEEQNLSTNRIWYWLQALQDEINIFSDSLVMAYCSSSPASISLVPRTSEGLGMTYRRVRT